MQYKSSPRSNFEGLKACCSGVERQHFCLGGTSLEQAGDGGEDQFTLRYKKYVNEKVKEGKNVNGSGVDLRER